MEGVLGEIIEILTGALPTMAQNIGEGLNALVNSIFLETAEGGSMVLSAFGGIVVVFAGIALCIGLSRLVVNMIRNFNS